MFKSKYGVARHIYIPIVKRAVVDFAVSADWTPAAGDVKISKDGGAAANVTNLPTAIAMGNTAIWDFSLTATEMQATQIVVTVADAATKAVEDQAFVIETYGNASAQDGFDISSATPTVNAAQWNGLTTVALPLVPTTAGRTLDVSATGEAGIDWANIAGVTTVVDFTQTTIKNLDGNTVQTGDAYARLGAPSGASVSADVAAVKAVLPAALTGGGNIKADALALNGDTTSAANIAKTTRAIARGTAAGAATTTSIPTSAFAPSGSVADQFKGRIVTFDADTTTAALRGQSTDITASTNAATPTLTVTALTTAPASGDTFSVT